MSQSCGLESDFDLSVRTSTLAEPRMALSRKEATARRVSEDELSRGLHSVDLIDHMQAMPSSEFSNGFSSLRCAGCVSRHRKRNDRGPRFRFSWLRMDVGSAALPLSDEEDLEPALAYSPLFQAYRCRCNVLEIGFHHLTRRHIWCNSQ